MRSDGLFKSDRHAALPRDSAPMRLYRIAFTKPTKPSRPKSQDLVETEPAGVYWPSCKDGPCEGGTQPCPTSDACRIPAQSDTLVASRPLRLFAEGKWANIAVTASLVSAVVFVTGYILTGHWPKYLF